MTDSTCTIIDPSAILASFPDENLRDLEKETIKKHLWIWGLTTKSEESYAMDRNTAQETRRNTTPRGHI